MTTGIDLSSAVTDAAGNMTSQVTANAPVLLGVTGAIAVFGLVRKLIKGSK
jgi:hypothetical protein